MTLAMCPFMQLVAPKIQKKKSLQNIRQAKSFSLNQILRKNGSFSFETAQSCG